MPEVSASPFPRLQFTLSTWLMLIVILAAAFVCRGPWLIVSGPDERGEASWHWGPDVIWPVRLFAALVIWKAGWAIVRRMPTNAAQSELRQSQEFARRSRMPSSRSPACCKVASRLANMKRTCVRPRSRGE